MYMNYRVSLLAKYKYKVYGDLLLLVIIGSERMHAFTSIFMCLLPYKNKIHVIKSKKKIKHNYDFKSHIFSIHFFPIMWHCYAPLCWNNKPFLNFGYYYDKYVNNSPAPKPYLQHIQQGLQDFFSHWDNVYWKKWKELRCK